MENQLISQMSLQQILKHIEEVHQTYIPIYIERCLLESYIDRVLTDEEWTNQKESMYEVFFQDLDENIYDELHYHLATND